MQEFKNVGCKAVTITGGGEPLCHPDFEEIITQIKRMGIEIGLVTNGVLLHKIDKSVLNQITWCRISHDDYRAFDEEYQEHLSKTVKDAYKVDWAFSYVLTRKPNFDNIASIIKFANGHKFTHVRIVSDLLDLGSVMNMDLVKMEMTKRGVDDHIVIYQGRKEWVKGAKKCYMSLLKPTVAANGMIAPCCGFQYKDEIPTRSYGKDGMMCNWTEIPEVWKKQEYYDGSVCKVCYYDDYNTALRIMISDLEHKVFI
jgi:MoaA/NifB/PqqE/SkfB family radical SAM enzyme